MKKPVLIVGVGILWLMALIVGSGAAILLAQSNPVPPKPLPLKVAAVPAPRETGPVAHRPSPPPIEPLPVNPEYVRLAEQIQWPGGSIAATNKNKVVRDAQDRAKFEHWLLDNEYSVFDEKQVEDYMTKQVNQANAKEKAKCPDEQFGRSCYRMYYSWSWFPLAGQEYTGGNLITVQGNMQISSCCVSVSSNGYNTADNSVEDTLLKDNKYRRDYTAPIPAEVLADAAAIKAAWPDAAFDVTAVDKHMDPFLAVRFPWGREIIAKWDEPDFGK